MTDSDDDDICGADFTTKEGVCENNPKYPDGRCGKHSDHTRGPGPNEGTRNNPDGSQKHGVRSERSLYYDRLPEAEKAFVDGMIDTFIEGAPFSKDNDGKVEIVRQAAIDLHKRRSANDYISQEGLAWEEVTDYYETSDGELKVITKTEEHYLNIAVDRLGRTAMNMLKNVGVLDDPGSQQADAQKSMVELLSGDE